MENNRLKFKEIQKMQWVLILNTLLVILLVITQYYDLDQKPSSIEFDVFAILLLSLTSLNLKFN